MRLRRKLLHGFALIALILPAAAYDKTSDQDLQNEYGGKVLTLRQRYWGQQLHFDAGGNFVGSGETGPWTVAGQVRVRDIAVKNGKLRIRGQRLFLFYDPASKSLRDAGTLPKGDPARKRFRDKMDDWVANQGKVEIDVETGESDPTPADETRAMNAVFLAPGEVLSDAVPVFWKKWLESQGASSNTTAKPDESAKPAYRVGKGVLPPHVKYDPDPVYSELARQAKYQGTSILWLIVGEDGVARHIRVATPLGMGLDEEAVRAVTVWKFDPATKDGTPVPVWITVEVNFRLYR
ncbi:MAG: energy transducer TonB [Candidatus Korobacteraceae bacterium]